MIVNGHISDTCETVTLVHSGSDYFSRLEQIIRDSKFEIHIQMYLFEDDQIGRRIINALKEAATRNVKIFILLDSYGSFYFPSKTVNELKQVGINIRFFSPLFSADSFYLGRRLHHKVVISDGTIALIGGINIADKYHGSETEVPWLDYAVEFTGKAVHSLQKLCFDMFYKKKRVRRKKNGNLFRLQKETIITILRNDWLKRKDEISDAYIQAIRNAEKEIIIVGSYFLPGIRIVRALKKASKNGVNIKLILSGKSDIILTKQATCYLYSKLLRYNIDLYEWDLSVLHGKAMVVDQQWTTIGSFNLNNLSSYGSIEVNLGIKSAPFSEMFQSDLKEIILKSQRITSESLTFRDNLFTKFINFISYFIARSTEIILTYLPYNRFNSS